MIAIFNMFTLLLIIGVVQEKKSSTGLLLYLDFVFVTDRKLEFRKLTSWMVDDFRHPAGQSALNHSRKTIRLLGSGCGTVDRAVASDTGDLQFKSRHRQFLFIR